MSGYMCSLETLNTNIFVCKCFAIHSSLASVQPWRISTDILNCVLREWFSLLHLTCLFWYYFSDYHQLVVNGR